MLQERNVLRQQVAKFCENFSQKGKLWGAIHSTKISGNFSLKVDGSVRSNGKVLKKLAHLLRWTTFLGLTGLIEMGRSIWPFRPILNSRTSLFSVFHVQNRGKYLSLHCYGLLIADLSVLLVHPWTVTTGLYLLCKQSVCFGCWRLLKKIYFQREFGMFFLSFDSNVVFEGIWQISGKVCSK